jgi:hypothetical protein
MDDASDGQDHEQFLLDAINHDSTAVYEQYGEEEAQATYSYLKYVRRWHWRKRR